MQTRPMMAAALAAAMAVAGTAQAHAQAAPGGGGWTLRDARADRVTGEETIAYGDDALQSLDFWRAKGVKGNAPLIVFVHGGGWQRGDKSNATGLWKVRHYPGEGYGFASINYRLVPDATVEQQARDVADAVKALIDRADRLGIDRRRIVLMGHSAGAHLVALVGTDERYLKAAGLSFADIAGVLPIDGAAYDIPAQIAESGPLMTRTYNTVFGSDPARQRFLSPTLHAAAPNAPAFLVLHVQRPDGISQSQALASALRSAGTRVHIEGAPGTGLRGHMTINRQLGDPNYPATGIVDAWLKTLFKR